MSEIITDFGDLNQLAQIVGDLQEKPRRAYRRAVSAGSSVVRKEMRARAPKRTGKLSRSFRFFIKPEGDGVVSHIGPGTLEYKLRALFIEKGTKARTTKIRGLKYFDSAKVLSDGKTIYGTRANHPGTPPRPFIQPAFEASKSAAKQEMARVLAEVIKGELSK